MKITGEYITLQNYLKFNDFIDSGAQSKQFLVEHDVKVNGEIEQRRGRKCYPGDVIEVDNAKDTIE